ncbi:MAG TPA: DEAD/DEAH box helicase, partial [Lapillicoccus sp.]
EELWQRTREARESAASLTGRFAPEVASVDVEPVRQAVREASTSFVIGRKGRLVRAAAPVLAHLRPGAEVDPKTLPAAVEEVARVRRLVGDIALSWRRLPGCAALDPAVNVLSEAGWQAVSDAVSVVERDRDLLAGLPANLSDGVQASRRFGEPLGPSEHRTLDAAGRALSAAVRHTGGSSEDEARFARGRGVLRTWAASAAERRADRPRGAALGRWVEASEALAPLGEALGEARWALLTGAVSPDDGPEALDRGLAAASVAERWDAAGFGSFEADRQDRTVSRFVDASERLRSSLTTALPAALLDRRPFRPGAFFGKVGALEREIGRTRGGLSVRRLVEEYGEVIGAITPCVLVSPDSLARFVPPGSMSFDLVVFDEASQITVADAVGALGRADAAVIAGDSKQMPPSVFAELSMDDADAVEAEFQVVPDEESILTEAVHAGVGRLWLSWHYRSQDESLIAFSNAAYYENRLSSFPAHPAQSHDTGVSFTRVAGTFLRSARGAGLDKGALRTNPVEAASVVAEVLRRWQARERSIGVVTFNIQQRALIESMLEESGVEGLAEALAAKRDGLFVKNLENVQGDERDVILFSTGFSANADGVLPLNFGPLNRSGGERRLNVAVTRARRR